MHPYFSLLLRILHIHYAGALHQIIGEFVLVYIRTTYVVSEASIYLPFFATKIASHVYLPIVCLSSPEMRNCVGL